MPPPIGRTARRSSSGAIGADDFTSDLLRTADEDDETPGTWAALRRDRTTIANVVEEGLRHDTSVIAWRRVAREVTTIGGTAVPAGAKLLLLLASANHDPARFPDPERFDPQRANARGHIAFGMGIH